MALSHENSTFTSPWNLTSSDQHASPGWAGLRSPSSHSADSQTMTPERIAVDDQYDEPSLPEVFYDFAMTPFRVLTSPTALRTYLRSILLALAAIVLLVLSAFAYAAFYYKYIPARGVTVPVHLQFDPQAPQIIGVNGAMKDSTATYPQGTAQLPPSTLISGQPYDAIVHICLPRTPENVDAGNFMIDLSLLGRWTSSPTTSSSPPTPDNGGEDKVAPILARSSRPAILPYTNPLTTAVTQLIYRTPRSLVGWNRGEQECLTLSMLERTVFASGKSNVPETVDLRVRSSLGAGLRVYSVSVEVRAVFGGLRWFMRRWKVVAALTGIGTFFGVSAAACLATWLATTFLLSGRGQSGVKPSLAGKDAATGINKREDDSALSTSDNQSSTPHVKNEEELDPALAGGPRGAEADDEEDDEEDDYVLDETMQEVWGAQDRDSGIGTSMESSAGGESRLRGVRRRGIKREDD